MVTEDPDPKVAGSYRAPLPHYEEELPVLITSGAGNSRM